jgi:predicted Rossmann fold flavoprotein
MDMSASERVPCDVAILGAGAAGLCAAIRAAERGRSVVLVEKNRRPGVKILMSGGTRCNITNARGLRRLEVVSGPVDPGYDRNQARGARSIMEAFGVNGAFLGPALRALSVEETVRLFEAEGVVTKVEGNGKVFPESDRAVDVLEALLRRLGRTEAVLRNHCAAMSLERATEGFRITTSDGDIHAHRVILTTGGLSFPGCGTTGDGLRLAQAMGHTIVPTRPALVPLRVSPPWVAELRGITLPDVVASVVSASGEVLQSRREAVLFAHFGLTGPAMLDISRAVARSERPETLRLRLDLIPDVKGEAVDREIQQRCRSGRPQVVSVLPGALPRRLGDAVVAEAGIPADRKGPDLSRDERRRLVGVLKGLELPIAGTLGYEKAEVTSGGVALSEVDPQTMESRLCPGLFFAGEVLDLDGLIGGYNFQAAWSTGWLAGSVV